MRDFFDPAAGERLSLDAYLDDFERRFWAITEHGFWKLERQQTFKEPGFDSWESFAAGRWDDALRQLDATRADLKEYFDQLTRHGISFKRARVVEEPIAPYLQWELHILRLREQAGEQIRVVPKDVVATYETDGPLPELITLGSDAMYQIIYDAQGILDGALRFTDRETITRCRSFIEDIYAEGEELQRYFGSVVTRLDPPRSA